MSRRPSTKVIAAIVVIVLLLAGGGIYLKRRSRNRDDGNLVEVTRKTIRHTLQLTGHIEPFASLVITPPESGRIVSVLVQEGAVVKGEDQLFSMRLEAAGESDLLQQRAEVQKLVMQVASDTASLAEKKPVRELLGQAAIVKEEADLEQERLALKTAQDKLDVLERNLGLHGPNGKKGAKTGKANATTDAGIIFVTAPSPGIVTLIDKRVGDYVSGGGAGDATSASDRMVMTIADMSSLIVRTRVLEADLRYVTKGLPVKVSLDAFPNSDYHGTVTRIGGQGRVDNKGGYTYFDVDITVDKLDPRALPQMNTTIELTLAERADVLALPLSAVAIFPDHAVVQMPDADARRGYQEKQVKVGIVTETEAEIVDGLKEHDQVREIDFATLDLGSGDQDDDAGSGSGSGHGSGHRRTGKSGGGGKGSIAPKGR